MRRRFLLFGFVAAWLLASGSLCAQADGPRSHAVTMAAGAVAGPACLERSVPDGGPDGILERGPWRLARERRRGRWQPGTPSLGPALADALPAVDDRRRRLGHRVAHAGSRGDDPDPASVR